MGNFRDSLNPISLDEEQHYCGKCNDTKKDSMGITCPYCCLHIDMDEEEFCPDCYMVNTLTTKH